MKSATTQLILDRVLIWLSEKGYLGQSTPVVLDYLTVERMLIECGVLPPLDEDKHYTRSEVAAKCRGSIDQGHNTTIKQELGEDRKMSVVFIEDLRHHWGQLGFMGEQFADVVLKELLEVKVLSARELRAAARKMPSVLGRARHPGCCMVLIPEDYGQTLLAFQHRERKMRQDLVRHVNTLDALVCEHVNGQQSDEFIDSIKHLPQRMQRRIKYDIDKNGNLKRLTLDIPVEAA
jgi:hypothetical protein